MSKAAFIDDEAFFEVTASPAPSDIPIDQPIPDDVINSEAIFEVSTAHAAAISAKKWKNLEHPGQAAHPVKPVSALCFPQSTQAAPSVQATPKPVIPIAKSTQDVVQLKQEAIHQATHKEPAIFNFVQKAKGADTMHALKKEPVDEQLRDTTVSAVNIVKSDDMGKTVPSNISPKSRIVPPIDTPHFQAFVVEKDASSEQSIIVLTGKIDHEYFQQLENFLNGVIQKSTIRLICDVGGLTSISSPGWGLLVSEMQRLRKRGGNLFLCGLQGEVERNFKVLELDKLFLTFRTVSDAIRSTAPESGNIRHFPKVKSQAAPLADNPASLSLEDKIQRIVAENPSLGTGSIHRLLRSEIYGKTKISRWRLISKLRWMNLGSKEERYRFFRSA